MVGCEDIREEGSVSVVVLWAGAIDIVSRVGGLQYQLLGVLRADQGNEFVVLRAAVID